MNLTILFWPVCILVVLLIAAGKTRSDIKLTLWVLLGVLVVVGLIA